MARLSGFLVVLTICTVAFLPAGCGKKEEPAAPAPGGSPAAPSSEESDAAAPRGTATAGSETPTPVLAQGATDSEGTTPVDSGQTTPTDFSQMAARNAEALKQMNQGKDIQPIALDTLKGFLPATLAGMKRGETDTRKMGMMGINSAIAQADYEATDGPGMLDLMIMDLGNASGPMRMGIAGWATAQVDKQTDTGYEKTVTYQGYKGIEEYDNQTKDGEFRVIVANRFVVEVTGKDVTMETIKQAMGQVDLKKLAKAAN